MIKTEQQYNEILQEIYLLMKKGEKNKTDAKTLILQQMISEVSGYEEETIKFPAPKTIVEMVELKLFQDKMTQTEFARKSGLGLPKVNQIINGKRPVDVPF
ncbi:MAG: hypothetical protein BWZ00_01310 [Bacteroidetes bacterium ADurb.BinA174]|jgi:HTH-type transcriptional regulator/antitoxin HigA|nr:MAG: hypothetical protein BWZ00_01310 [Bacteroidetes bacterium ADurb.BinA174]